MSFNSVIAAEELLSRYGALDGEALLEPLIEHELIKGRLCLVSSFGTEAALLLSMVAKIDPALPVIFLDSQKLFQETLAYRDELIKLLGLKNVQTVYPDYSDTTRDDPEGTLWETRANACCYIRKVKPLQKALKNYVAWITGRKRYHGGLRSNMPVIESFEGRVKINPLAAWSPEDIAREFIARKLPEHPLKAKGYLSIGCLPCTDLPVSGQDARSGRWKGSDKEECGIHLDEYGKFRRSG